LLSSRVFWIAGARFRAAPHHENGRSASLPWWRWRGFEPISAPVWRASTPAASTTVGQLVVPPEVRESGGSQFIGIVLSSLAPLFQIAFKRETASIVLAHGQIHHQVVAPCPDECDVCRKFVVQFVSSTASRREKGRKSPTAADAKLLLAAHRWLHVRFGCVLGFEGIVVQDGCCHHRWSSNFHDAFSGREIAEFGRDRELSGNDKRNQCAGHKKVFHACVLGYPSETSQNEKSSLVAASSCF
jgi:hypothetical protein